MHRHRTSEWLSHDFNPESKWGWGLWRGGGKEEVSVGGSGKTVEMKTFCRGKKCPGGNDAFREQPREEVDSEGK